MKFLMIAACMVLATAAPQQQSYSYTHSKPEGAYGKPRVVATITKTITKPVTYQVPVATITSSDSEPARTLLPASTAPLISEKRQPATHPYIAILKLERNQVPSGDYSFSYLSENGIQASEKAVLKSVRDEKNDEQVVPNVEGSYSYTGPDGVIYTVNYVADELGYHASGSHLPTPPPIPEAIRATLANSQANGQANGQANQ